jgi:hypothetical protein
MFGYSQIIRHARRWRESRRRMLMERTLMDLPVELQKDIGWPRCVDHPSALRGRNDLHARPML